MKVVFLDIDGVLNSRLWFERRETNAHNMANDIDPEAAARVQRLCDETGAVLVISSTWRLIHQLNAIRTVFKSKGLTAHVIGKTPERPRGDRGDEIQRWLDLANLFPLRPSGMVIIDDDADMLHLMPWLVKTTFFDGFTDSDVTRAAAMLSRPMPPITNTTNESNG